MNVTCCNAVAALLGSGQFNPLGVEDRVMAKPAGTETVAGEYVVFPETQSWLTAAFVVSASDRSSPSAVAKSRSDLEPVVTVA